jgi:hypothetical protein
VRGGGLQKTLSTRLAPTAACGSNRCPMRRAARNSTAAYPQPTSNCTASDPALGLSGRPAERRLLDRHAFKDAGRHGLTAPGADPGPCTSGTRGDTKQADARALVQGGQLRLRRNDVELKSMGMPAALAGSFSFLSTGHTRSAGSRIKRHRALCVSHARQDKSSCPRLRIEPLFSVHANMAAQQLRFAGSTLSLPAE